MGRRNKPWFRADVGWWVTNIGRKQFRLAKGKSKNDKASEKEAERAFHELMALRPQGPDAHDARVCDLAEAFLEFAERKRYSADTYRNYRFYIMGFCEFRGFRPAAGIIPHDVTKWIDTKKWNDTTEYNAKRTVFRLFSWAKDEGLLAANPLKGLRREKPETTRRCLLEHEYCSLLRGARRPFRVFLWSLMETGARPSELRRLKWTDVRDGRFVIKHHKTAKKTGKDRVIYMTKRMKQRIEQLQGRSSSPYVFVNSRGKPWTGNAIRLQVDRIKKRLGLADDICAYMVRHTFATWALVRGVDPATLAELLGHTSTDMIMKVYLHLAEQKQHMAIAVEQAVRRTLRPTPAANGKNPNA